jgi:hypothetical protein
MVRVVFAIYYDLQRQQTEAVRLTCIRRTNWVNIKYYSILQLKCNIQVDISPVSPGSYFFFIRAVLLFFTFLKEFSNTVFSNLCQHRPLQSVVALYKKVLMIF